MRKQVGRLAQCGCVWGDGQGGSDLGSKPKWFDQTTEGKGTHTL